MSGPGFYMDKYLRSNLDLVKLSLRKDWDSLIIIDGLERAGKSVLAQQCSTCVDPTFTIDGIAFHGKQFKDIVLSAKKYQARIFDEALRGLSARRSMSHLNTVLVQMLAEIGQKNLPVFVLLPSFFDLDRNIALWRARALIHVYTQGVFERGYFSFYSGKRKKELYIKGKKTYDYRKVEPNFRGRFSNHYTVDEQEYRKRKREAHEKATKEDIKTRQVIEHEHNIDIVSRFLEWNDKQPYENQLPKREFADILGVHPGSLSRIIKEILED